MIRAIRHHVSSCELAPSSLSNRNTPSHWSASSLVGVIPSSVVYSYAAGVSSVCGYRPSLCTRTVVVVVDAGCGLPRAGWAARGPCAWFTLISRFQVSTAAPGLGPRQRRALVANNASAKKCNSRCNVVCYLEVLGVSRITITGGAYPSVPAPWQDGWFSP